MLSAVGVSAIELSLEENRAERGSVGYVDMQRLFKASPDASRAREGLEELVRQAEELVNSRKAAILRLRSDLGRLKSERETLAASTPTAVATPQSPPLDVHPVAPAPPVAAVSTIAAAAVPPAVAASTRAATPLTINLPGLAEGPLNLERPGGSPLDPSRNRSAAPGAEASAQPAEPTMAQRLMEFDGLILGKQAELDRLQAELDRERLDAEQSLLDAEGRKTDQVLARLYRALAEVAKREGVSVVIDKAATLYGHPAVDLTDKILKQLKGAAPTP